MTLRERQSLFVRLLGLLINYAYTKGYELTLGDGFRDGRVTYGHPRSLHRERLAVDLNLFKDGQYISDSEGHEELGIFWESLHPDTRWGGRFEDGNHYSLTYDERA